MGILEAIISLFTKYIPSLGNWLWKKMRFYWFRLFMSKKPFSDEKAKQIAQAVLSGQIEEAISFRNMNSSRSYICVLKREHMHDIKIQLVILEELGETFTSVYQKELYKFPSEIEVIDIDKDGIHEVAYILEDAGSGGGSRTLEIYSFKQEKVFSLSEYYNWSDATKNDPNIEIDEEMNPDFKKSFESYAVKKEFLEKNYVDLDDPENAVLNWHRMNGKKEEGEIKLQFYEGPPKYGSSIIETIETNFIKWVAHFKGPIYGVLKAKNQHFIAFSPSNKYNWATCITAFPNKIIFGTNSREGIYAFEYKKGKGKLHFVEKIGWQKLPYITKLKKNGDKLIINNSLEFSINEIIEN